MAGALGATGSTFLVLAVGVPAFQSAMPSPQESRLADGTNPFNRAQVRSGEIMGTAVLLAIGAAVSALEGSPAALVLAALTAALLTLVHEMLLRQPGFRLETPA